MEVSAPPPCVDDETLVIKVKQPYAYALVARIKDCENRTWSLPAHRVPGWVLVASSKASPSCAHMHDAWHRQARQPSEGGQSVGAADDLVRGAILGMIYVQECCTSTPLPWSTVWHNPPDVAWRVTGALEFAEAIPLDEDDKFQIKVSLGKRPQYAARVARAIQIANA